MSNYGMLKKCCEPDKSCGVPMLLKIRSIKYAFGRTLKWKKSLTKLLPSRVLPFWNVNLLNQRILMIICVQLAKMTMELER